MPLTPQTQRLYSQQELLRRKRIERCPNVSQYLNSDTNGERDGAKRVPEFEAVIAFAGIVELGEAGCIFAPVKFAAVDYETTNGRAMPPYPLRRGMHDNVGAVIDRAAEVASCAKGIVNHNRNTMLMRHLGNLLEIRHVIPRISNALQVDRLGLIINQFFKFLCIIAFDESRRYAHAWEGDLELVVSAAIEVGGRDDVVACVGEGGNGHELGGLA